MGELVPEIETDDRRPGHAIVRDLCGLASWWHAAGNAERRDVAIDLAADLLAGESATT